MNRIIPVKRFAIALCSAIALLATACGPSRPSNASSASDASHPSDAEIRAAIERGISVNSGKVKVIAFKKTDGQDSNVFGVQVYAMSYEANSECTDDSGCVVCPPGPSQGNPSAHPFSVPDGFSDSVFPRSSFKAGGARIPSECKQIDKGGNLTTHGKVTLSKSENGWTGK